MNFKNVTMPQAIIFVAMLAAVIAVYKMFGEKAGVAMLAIQSTITFLMGRGDPPPPNAGAGGPDLKVLPGGAGGSGSPRAIFGLVLACSMAACAGALPAADDPELVAVAAKLAKCRGEARAYVQTSADPHSRETALAAYDIYQRCKAREGVQ